MIFGRCKKLQNVTKQHIYNNLRCVSQILTIIPLPHENGIIFRNPWIYMIPETESSQTKVVFNVHLVISLLFSHLRNIHNSVTVFTVRRRLLILLKYMLRTQETWLISRRQQPCPHSIRNHHTVLFLCYPLHKNKKIKSGLICQESIATSLVTIQID